MSQIGYMFLALGVQAWDAAIFHLMTHTFFKALLFLASGSIIPGLPSRTEHLQDGRSASIFFRWFMSASWRAAQHCRRCR